MHPFSSVPVLRLLIPFCLGIVLQIFFPLNYILLIGATVCFSVVAISFTFIKKLFQSYKYRWVFGIAITFFMLFYAMLLVTLSTENFRPSYFENVSSSPSGYALRLKEPYHEKEKSLKAVAQVEALLIKGKWLAVTGNIILYLEKIPEAYSLNYGDIIYTSGIPEAVKGPQNPGSFNYKRFLMFHGIYHQLYLKKGSWVKNRSQ